MADYSSIGDPLGIIYTCNCGWLDRGHSKPKSTRPGIGPSYLWKAILNEQGLADTFNRRPAFVLHFRQDAVKNFLGLKFYPGYGKTFVIQKGLSHQQKQEVALAIFIDISLKFEETQDSWVARALTGTDSGFSEEDLVSNLIAFYTALNPKLNVDSLCKPVSVKASQDVWKTAGAVGKNKNRTFTPKFHPCSECSEQPAFPKEFQRLAPARKGELFDEWVPLPQMVTPFG